MVSGGYGLQEPKGVPLEKAFRLFLPTTDMLTHCQGLVKDPKAWSFSLRQTEYYEVAFSLSLTL